MAIGMTMVIITGQIDLSLGSSLVLCTGVTIMAFNASGGNVLVMLLAALGSGFLCGLINGVMVAYAKMPAFIATLGTQLIYRSLTLSVVRKIDPALSPDIQDTFQGLVLIAVIFIQTAGPVIKEKIKSIRKRAKAN